MSNAPSERCSPVTAAGMEPIFNKWEQTTNTGHDLYTYIADGFCITSDRDTGDMIVFHVHSIHLYSGDEENYCDWSYLSSDRSKCGECGALVPKGVKLAAKLLRLGKI